MLTYNQEKFISQTIESVLMQKTNFSYQLVIGEDASTDATGEICKKYAEKFHDKIKLLSSGKNLGLIQNFIRTYKECDGKYVAILDGDDYWTDPYKLQKQVDFMEAYPSHSTVFTGFKKLYPDGRIISKNYSAMPVTTDFRNIVRQNYICSATVMFRNKTDSTDFPNWIEKFPYGDWPLYLWTSRKGEKIARLEDETAVYRMKIGVSGKLKEIQSEVVKVNLGILECVQKDSNFQFFQKEIRNSLIDHKLSLAMSYLREQKIWGYLKMFLDLIIICPKRLLNGSLYTARRIFSKKLQGFELK
ncbi:glycosyltransferase [Actinomadura fibrosa]